MRSCILFLFLLVCAWAAAPGTASAQGALVESFISRYGHDQIFKVRYRNTSAKNVRLTDDHREDLRNECKVEYSQTQLAPGESADLRLVCHFVGTRYGSSGPRSTRVFLNVSGDGQKLEIPLSFSSDGTTFSLHSPETIRIQRIFPQLISQGAQIRIVNSAQKPRLVLQGSSCITLMDQISAIQALALKMDGKSYAATGCTCDWKKPKLQECEIVADSVLPKVLADEVDLSPVCRGPNCWNSSLRLSRLLPNPRYTDQPEMKNWLSSPLCQEIGPAVKPSLGDIIAIRDANGNEVHGFTYLTDQLSYSKNGLSNAQVYRFASPENIFNEPEYKVDPACRHYSGLTKKPAACTQKFHAQYFHCISYDEFKRSILRKYPHYGQIEIGLRRIDETLSQISVQGCTKSGEVLDKVQLDQLSTLVTELQKFDVGKSADRRLKFYQSQIVEAAKSLQSQIYYIRQKFPN